MMSTARKAISALVLISLSCFAYADPPAESGGVVRFQVDDFWDMAIDFDDNMTAFFGIDVVGFCNALMGGDDPTPYLAGTVNFQQMWKKDGTRFHSHYTAYLQTSVWGAVSPDCGYILTNEPLAVGEIHAVWNDNDVFPNLNPNRRNRNSVGYHINGGLFSPEGERLEFHLNWHASWDGLDFASFKEHFRMTLK